MQSGGQYGMPDMAQFMVGRTTPHLFTHSQNLSPSPQHGPHANELQQQHHAPQQSIHPQQRHQHHSQLYRHQQTQPQLQQPLNLHQHHTFQENQPPQQHQFVHQLGLPSDSPELKTALTNSRAPPSQFQPLISAGDPLADDEVVPDEDDKRGTCNRWPKEEAIALLRIRSEMDNYFRESGLKGPLWEEVSRKLAELGYNRSAKKCKEKFENVHKYYKKTKDGRSGRQDGKGYRFLGKLEALYAANTNHQSDGSGHVGGGSTAQAHVAGTPYLTGNGGIGAAAEGISTVHRSDTSSASLIFSSNSSEDAYGEPQEKDEHESTKKRKRKSWSSTKVFFENFAKQVMEQQEILHKKFLETIERRDQERLIREERYKLQEMDRLNREHELRAQEHALAAARDAALVTFLQKVTGQTLQLPQIPLTPILTSTPEVQEDQEKDSSDLNTRRWPKTEVHALIRLRSGMEPRFQETGPKAHLWEDISTSMARIGFHRSAKRCKEKWENINKYFRKTKDSCRKRPDNAKTCPYFHQLQTLYQKGFLTSPNNRFNNVESHSESLENGEDSGQLPSGRAEMLAIVSAGEQCRKVTTSNLPFGSMGKNGMGGDPVSKTVRPVQGPLPDSNGSQGAISSLNMERIHEDDGISSSAKSLQVEGFVKDILEIQQQKHQKLLDEYERMEQVREIREQERKRQQEVQLAQELSHSNTQDNAALMALVHKLAGDSGEFALSAPSITD